MRTKETKPNTLKWQLKMRSAYRPKKRGTKTQKLEMKMGENDPLKTHLRLRLLRLTAGAASSVTDAAAVSSASAANFKRRPFDGGGPAGGGSVDSNDLKNITNKIDIHHFLNRN